VRPEPVTTVAIPYVRGVSEPIRWILAKVNIRVAFKTGTSIWSILTKVKPQRPPGSRKGMIYSIPCLDCDKVYIGETGRTLCTRQSEHRWHLNNGRTEDSAVAAHAIDNDHGIDWENSIILNQEDNFFKRRIKEAILIQKHDNFNQGIGLAVSPIWTSVVQRCTSCKITLPKITSCIMSHCITSH